MQENNLQILDRRWPQLSEWLQAAQQPESVELVTEQENETVVIDGIHLTSRFDRRTEAALQAGLVPQGSARARVYGLALGDLPRELLQRQELQQLEVIILNPAVAKVCMTCFDQSDWLDDPRVTLLTAAGKNDVEPPFAAAPACLQLADESSMRLRDRVFLALATPYIRSKHSAQNAHLAARLVENSPYVEADGDAASLFGKQRGRTVAVAAAGPTLAQHYEFIRENRPQLFLAAVDAALQPLLKAGITPDVVVVIDGHDEKILPFFTGMDLACMQETPLVYFPIVHQQVLDRWPGPRLTAYPLHPLYRDLARRFPKGDLFSSGSVIHPTIDLLVKMGAAEIILLGADFSFPGEVSHVENCVVRQAQPKSSYEHWVLNGYAQRVNTTAAMRGFLCDLESYIQHHPQVKFINTSRDGAAIEGTCYLEDGKW